MKIGDIVTEMEAESRKLKQGTVVYIHPEQRYYEVEFEYPGGKYRESYVWTH